MNRSLDVAILGDGPAGCATALTLAERGVRVAMIGPGKRKGRRIPENLGPEARAPLEKLGLWARFVAQGHPRCWAARSAWGSGELRERNSIRHAGGAGWLIDRDRLDPWMLSACAHAGVPWFARCPSGRVKRGSRGNWDILVEGGSSVEARVAVDAAGRNSRFAVQEGAVREIWDHMTGVCALVEQPAASEENSTLVESTEHGWWYSAPAADRRLAVAYMSDPDLLRAHQASTPGGWLNLLAQTTHTSRRAGSNPVIDGPLCIAPAGSSRLRAPAGARWIACGDAAASYDPLSSLGVQSALESGMSTAGIVFALIRGVSGSSAAGTRDPWLSYIANRNAYYGLERRWPESSFWQRRQTQSRFFPASTHGLEVRHGEQR
jgi:2-polyprenyl-6-methoxyphenol hydroxylase-like FAD-dependent oxidoreductase